MSDATTNDPTPLRHLDRTFLPEGVAAPLCREDILQMAAFEPWSLVHGPGRRAVVWVAGCLRRCPGCMKPEYFSFSAGTAISVDVLAEHILAIPELTGVSYSGGEPFEHALPLAALSKKLRAAGLSILTYSGYRLVALQQDPRFLPLLIQTDLLIDGEYRNDLPGPFRWRGSANQVFHELTDRRLHADNFGLKPSPTESPTREVQVSLTARGLRLSGFPDQAMEKELAERLHARGIMLTPDPDRSNLK